MTEDAASTDRPRSRRFAAFEVRNFRAYVVGQFVSSVGTWMQTLALAWLVLELTGRSDRLGVVVALQFLPLLLLGPMAGVVADRIDNRRLLVITSALSGTLAVILGAVVATHHVTIWWIYTLSLALGVVGALERPTMQAILFQLVGPDRLSSAVAINQSINTTSRMIGPAIAGFAIATLGLAPCFIINGASYVVVIVALLLLRRDELQPRPLQPRGRGQLRRALTYVRGEPDVLRPLVVMAVVGTLAYNFQLTIPAMVRFGFDRGAGSVGAVLSISAIGSIIGGMTVAGMRPHPVRTLALVLFGLAGSLTLFGLAPNYATFVVFGIVLGIGSTSFLVVDTTVLQRSTDPSMMGRVMSLHQVAWQGSTPIGALLMGWLIESTSPRAPFLVGAASALACGVWVSTARPRVTDPVGSSR